MTHLKPCRSRARYARLILLAIGLGLASRSKQIPWPAFVASYAGDTLWALTAFLGVGFLWPRWPTRRVAPVAAAFSAAIELSQLYQSPWINALRRNRIGALALGHGFLWSDLLCYAAGVILGVLLDRRVAFRDNTL
jgi:hypothetical protein